MILLDNYLSKTIHFECILKPGCKHCRVEDDGYVLETSKTKESIECPDNDIKVRAINEAHVEVTILKGRITKYVP